MTRRRVGWGAAGLAILGLSVWLMLTAAGGTPDPTNPSEHLSHLAVVVDSGILVLREGLETILVLAVLTASMRGANGGYRKPLAAGAGAALAAAVGTWFIAIAVTDAVGPGSLDLQAATGLLAIVVLLVVMNWFFHRVYWTGWIASHNRRRKALIGGADSAGMRRTMLGLGLLGFTSVYREGFEVVLFLQTLRLRYGSATVLEGVALGLVFVAAIGYLTFGLQRRLPYRKMLVATGVLLGFVLLVMVGGVRPRATAGGLDRDDSDPRRDPGMDGAVVLDLPERRDDRRPGGGGRARAGLLLRGRGAEGPQAATRGAPPGSAADGSPEAHLGALTAPGVARVRAAMCLRSGARSTPE